MASLTPLLLIIAWVFMCSPAMAQGYKNEDEEARAYNVTRTIKTVEGLNFVVEADRPIEKVGSIYRPLDMDSYVALKFNKLLKIIEEKFAALQERVSALEAEVARLQATHLKAISGSPAEGRAVKNQTTQSPPPQAPVSNKT